MASKCASERLDAVLAAAGDDGGGCSVGAPPVSAPISARALARAKAVMIDLIGPAGKDELVARANSALGGRQDGREADTQSEYHPYLPASAPFPPPPPTHYRR